MLEHLLAITGQVFRDRTASSMPFSRAYPAALTQLVDATLDDDDINRLLISILTHN
jgi:hypothetical protein